MNKYRIINYIRRNYPETFGIRKKLQRVKVERIKKRLLPDEIVKECEQNPELIKKLVRTYSEKDDPALRHIQGEMDSILSNASFQTTDEVFLRDDMSFCRLAYGFLPSEYCGFELEKKLPDERREFMSDIDTYIFGNTVNDISVMQRVIDKGQSVNMFGYLFRRDYLVVSSRRDFPAFMSFVKKHPVFVVKNTNSSMGKNIEKVNISELGDSAEYFFKSLLHRGKVLLEELVIQSREMAIFNESSVNTVRCMTFCTSEGIVVPYCFMRVGRSGSFVDNGGAGGIIIGVNPHTGVVDTDGFDEYNNHYFLHPDSGITFKGFKIPDWERMLNICKSAALKITEMGFLSWDMAHTDDGWSVIEVNGVGQLIGPQIVYRRGIKKEIEQYLASMKKMI